MPLRLLVFGFSIVICLCVPAPEVLAQQDPAGDESEFVVRITEQDLPWSVGENGSMAWSTFGTDVSEESLCSEVSIGGPVASLALDLVFDVEAESLSGRISGAMVGHDRAPGDRATGSFSGEIQSGWVEQTPDGWAWGGTAEVAMAFAGASVCAQVVDDAGGVIEQIVAEGEGSRSLIVEFLGGARAYAPDHGFRLHGEVWVDETGRGWHLTITCFRCDLPIPWPGERVAGAPDSASVEAPATTTSGDEAGVSGAEPTGDTSPADGAGGISVGGLLLWAALVLGAGALVLLIWALIRRRTPRTGLEALGRGAEEVHRLAEEEEILRRTGAPSPGESVPVSGVEAGQIKLVRPVTVTRDNKSITIPPGTYQYLDFTWWAGLPDSSAEGGLLGMPDGRGGTIWVPIEHEMRAHLGDSSLGPLDRVPPPPITPWPPTDPRQVPPPPPGVAHDTYGHARLASSTGKPRLVLEEWDPADRDRPVRQAVDADGTPIYLEPGPYFVGKAVGDMIPVYSHTHGCWGWVHRKNLLTSPAGRWERLTRWLRAR